MKVGTNRVKSQRGRYKVTFCYLIIVIGIVLIRWTYVP